MPFTSASCLTLYNRQLFGSTTTWNRHYYTEHNQPTKWWHLATGSIPMYLLITEIISHPASPLKSPFVSCKKFVLSLDEMRMEFGTHSPCIILYYFTTFCFAILDVMLHFLSIFAIPFTLCFFWRLFMLYTLLRLVTIPFPSFPVPVSATITCLPIYLLHHRQAPDRLKHSCWFNFIYDIQLRQLLLLLYLNKKLKLLTRQYGQYVEGLILLKHRLISKRSSALPFPLLI
jgi:hypothetical protein